MVSAPSRWCLGTTLRVGITAAVVVALLLAVMQPLHDMALRALRASVSFFQGRSLHACVAYVFLLATAMTLGSPICPLEIFAGYCFGVWLAVPLDLIGRLLGSGVSFQIARHLSTSGMRCPFVQRTAEWDAVLRGVGRAVETGGIRFLVLFNVMYVPAAVKNYSLGMVPEVPFASFLTAICLVEVPHAALFATAGAAASQEATLGHAGDAHAGLAAASERHWHVRFALLCFGVAAFMAVLHTISSRVSVELENLRAAGTCDGSDDAEAPTTGKDLHKDCQANGDEVAPLLFHSASA